MGKWCLHASSFIFDRTIIKVAGNQDRHKSLVEFNFGPNQTTHFGVTCPWVTQISYFWTWISLKLVGQFWSNFMCSITVGWGKCIRVWGRLDQNSGFHGNRKPPLTYNGENGVSTFSRLLLIRSFLYLQVTMSPPFLGRFWSDPFKLACTKYKESYCSHPGCPRPRSRHTASLRPSFILKFSKSSYLDSHSSESIHIGPAFIPWFLTPGLMPRGGARGQNLGHL